MHGTRHVFRRADARERRGREDARALLVGKLSILWPRDRPWGYAVDAHAGASSSASERVIAARPALAML